MESPVRKDTELRGQLMKHANWRFVEASSGAIVIKDVGPWDDHKTVTNDAEHVVEELLSSAFLLPSQRLLYIDSLGRKDEILFDEDGFKNIKILLDHERFGADDEAKSEPAVVAERPLH